MRCLDVVQSKEIEIFLHWMHNVRHADYTAITIIDQKNCSAVIQQSLQWTETDGSSQQPVSCLSQADFTCIPTTILQNIMCKCAKSFSFWGTSSPRSPTAALPLDPTRGLPSPEPPDWPMFILGLSGEFPFRKIRNPPKIQWDQRTKGMNSWLDNTDTNFGPDLPLLFKLHEIRSVDSQENR